MGLLVRCFVINSVILGCVAILEKDLFSPTTSSSVEVTNVGAINSQRCKDKRSCNTGYPFLTRNCYCDKLCTIMDDCCYDYKTSQENDTSMFPKQNQFHCLRIPGSDHGSDFASWLVDKCPKIWTESETRGLCEDVDVLDNENVYLKTPVSDIVYPEIVYKNMYCAYCNFVHDFKFWISQYSCFQNRDVKNIANSSDCALMFTAPDAKNTVRPCSRKEVVSTCAKGTPKSQVKACTKGPYFTVLSSANFSVAYRNEFCAQCNGILDTSLYCERPFETSDADIIRILHVGRSYSLRLLVDLNTGNIQRNSEKDSLKLKCSDDEMYDVVYDICRKIFCVEPAIAVAGRCVRSTLGTETVTKSVLDNCTWTKLSSDEYIIRNDSTLYFIPDNKTFDRQSYTTNGSNVFVCLDKIEEECQDGCNKTDLYQELDETESFVSMVGLILSVVALAITVLVYISLPQLLNTPGKILVCLVISLLLAQLLFLLSSEVESISWLCTTFGIAIHYFFLSAFCWMNVIAFDLWMTFSNRIIVRDRTPKRLLFYSMYAWLLPLLIVCVAIAINFSNTELTYISFRPNYGQGVCWITSRNALIVFFIAPLALFKLFDFTSFAFTAYHITVAKRQGTMATKKRNTCDLLIYIKLSLVMGLTWIFAFTATFSNNVVLWYLFIVFNSLQGLFIALSFLCTKKVGRLMGERLGIISPVVSMSSSSSRLNKQSKNKHSPH